jgi:hypothetical protein
MIPSARLPNGHCNLPRRRGDRCVRGTLEGLSPSVNRSLTCSVPRGKRMGGAHLVHKNLPVSPAITDGKASLGSLEAKCGPRVIPTPTWLVGYRCADARRPLTAEPQEEYKTQVSRQGIRPVARSVPVIVPESCIRRRLLGFLATRARWFPRSPVLYEVSTSMQLRPAAASVAVRLFRNFALCSILLYEHVACYSPRRRFRFASKARKDREGGTR